MLRRAGVVSGMRVLDVGFGVGDVSLLAAEPLREIGELALTYLNLVVYIEDSSKVNGLNKEGAQ